MWNEIAFREAVINSYVHNDYTREVAPKFEIFDDRLEITSYGSLPDGLSRKEFFEGVSILRNKELMRIYKDLELVEQLGSGIPRILEAYPKESFHFSENFLRVVFPSTEINLVTEQVTEQATEQVIALISSMKTGSYRRHELMDFVKIKHRPTFLYNYLQSAIKTGLVGLTIPDKPTSSKQQYFLIEKGKEILKALNHLK